MKLREIKFEITREKIQDKIGSIVTIFKIQKNKANKKSQGLDILKYDQVIDNIFKSIIKEILLSKYF